MAVSGHGLVGVDIEDLDSISDADAMARATLTASERQRFGSLPDRDRTAWLLWAWTRKECAMKVTGLGLRAAPGLIDVAGPTVSAAVPRWPSGTIHLYELNAPTGSVAALATTVPLVALHRFELPDDPYPRLVSSATGPQLLSVAAPVGPKPQLVSVATAEVVGG